MRLHAKTLEAVDDLISKEADDPSRPEMIRRLLKAVLKDKGYEIGEWVE